MEIDTQARVPGTNPDLPPPSEPPQPVPPAPMPPSPQIPPETPPGEPTPGVPQEPPTIPPHDRNAWPGPYLHALDSSETRPPLVWAEGEGV